MGIPETKCQLHGENIFKTGSLFCSKSDDTMWPLTQKVTLNFLLSQISFPRFLKGRTVASYVILVSYFTMYVSLTGINPLFKVTICLNYWGFSKMKCLHLFTESKPSVKLEMVSNIWELIMPEVLELIKYGKTANKVSLLLRKKFKKNSLLKCPLRYVKDDCPLLTSVVKTTNWTWMFPSFHRLICYIYLFISFLFITK